MQAVSLNVNVSRPRLRALLGALALAVAVPAGADEGQTDELKLQEPAVPPVATTPQTVRVPGPPKSYDRPSKDAGALKNLRALSVAKGEARISLNGVERTLRPGDVVEGDVVKAIGDGRLVLGRREPEGEATVIVSFDAQGRAVVRVLSLADRSVKPLVVR